MDNTAVAIRCYYEGVEGLSNQIELHYISEVKPGYFWLFPAGEGKANIGIGLSKNDAKKENRTLTNIMEEVTRSEYFKKRFSNAKPLEKPKGWNLPMGSIHRKNYGDGYMLLGDAAGLIDPFTGEDYPDTEGSALEEKLWLRSWTNNTYLWYDEVDDNPPEDFTVEAYFAQLKTNGVTPTGSAKDNFHFSQPTDEYNIYSQLNFTDEVLCAKHMCRSKSIRQTDETSSRKHT